MTLNFKIYFTVIITILIGAHLTWDYYHGGVPTHHILHRADMPGISNWWGGIVLPLFTWFMLYLIQKRINKNDESGTENNQVNIVYRFLVALAYGVLLSFFFSIGSDFPAYMMIGVMLTSFFVPLYKPEYLLGFVLGMTYTFGAILPIGIGTLLVVICIIAYKVVRSGILYIVSKIRVHQ